MAINKNGKQQQSDNVINTLIHARPEVFKKSKKEKKLKNLRIDSDIVNDYEILCEYILKSSFTDEVIKFIQDEIYNYKSDIEHFKKTLNL